MGAHNRLPAPLDMKPLFASLLAAAAVVAAAPPRQTFVGTITDEMCPTGDHSHMKMGANDAECTVACVGSHGASYVLFDGKHAYSISDQRGAEQFAGQKVKVIGSLDVRTKTIRVVRISGANK